MERWLSEFHQSYQAELDEIANIGDCRLEQTIPCGCDSSDYANDWSLMQCDKYGAERVVCYQSRHFQPSERKYSVHYKELLAMKYALAKFLVYILGDRTCIVYIDHVALRTAKNSSHLSKSMARWMSIFAEYNG